MLITLGLGIVGWKVTLTAGADVWFPDFKFTSQFTSEFRVAVQSSSILRRAETRVLAGVRVLTSYSRAYANGIRALIVDIGALAIGVKAFTAIIGVACHGTCAEVTGGETSSAIASADVQ